MDDIVRQCIPDVAATGNARLPMVDSLKAHQTICRQTNSWSVNSQTKQLSDWTIARSSGCLLCSVV